MAYTTIDDPSKHHQTKVYTGNGSSNHAITFDGNSNMQPDWLWNKVSSEADSHASWDSSRGNTKLLYPNITLAEDTDGNGNIDKSAYVTIQLGNIGSSVQEVGRLYGGDWLLMPLTTADDVDVVAVAQDDNAVVLEYVMFYE